jgi:hypothetical protein
MALALDIMKGGVSAGSAKAIGGTVITGLTATGTTITDALALTASINVVSTASASTGVKIPSMEIGDEIEILNLGANAVKVYPETGASINQLAASAGFLLSPNTAVKVKKYTSTKLVAYLSA